jgi:predicted DNA-binding protein (UPF0251 family)
MYDKFEDIKLISTLIAREYAEGMFRLLSDYDGISASEAASRLDIHIRTAQDFLESLLSLGLVSKTEVLESRKPFFRYSIAEPKVELNFDLRSLSTKKELNISTGHLLIEKNNEAVSLNYSEKEQRITAITRLSGRGRDKKLRRISLTPVQGKFLYYLPFPTAKPESIDSLMLKAGLPETCLPEIYDIIGILLEFDAIICFSDKY